jgi:hypothetical protein
MHLLQSACEKYVKARRSEMVEAPKPDESGNFNERLSLILGATSTAAAVPKAGRTSRALGGEQGRKEGKDEEGEGGGGKGEGEVEAGELAIIETILNFQATRQNSGLTAAAPP